MSQYLSLLQHHRKPPPKIEMEVLYSCHLTALEELLLKQNRTIVSLEETAEGDMFTPQQRTALKNMKDYLEALPFIKETSHYICHYKEDVCIYHEQATKRPPVRTCGAYIKVLCECAAKNPLNK